MKTSACNVCDYVATFAPDQGFIAFRAGLPRVGIDTLRAACERLGGRGCTFGLQLRDQLVNLLWEKRLAAAKSELSVVKDRSVKAANPAPTSIERDHFKKQKTDTSAVIIAVERAQVDESLQQMDTQALVTELSEEMKQLRSETQKVAEIQQLLVQKQQQLADKYAEVIKIVERLQYQQDISDRLLCTVHDQHDHPASFVPPDFVSLIPSFVPINCRPRQHCQMKLSE